MYVRDERSAESDDGSFVLRGCTRMFHMRRTHDVRIYWDTLL